MIKSPSQWVHWMDKQSRESIGNVDYRIIYSQLYFWYWKVIKSALCIIMAMGAKLHIVIKTSISILLVSNKSCMCLIYCRLRKFWSQKIFGAGCIDENKSNKLFLIVVAIWIICKYSGTSITEHLCASCITKMFG